MRKKTPPFFFHLKLAYIDAADNKAVFTHLVHHACCPTPQEAAKLIAGLPVDSDGLSVKAIDLAIQRFHPGVCSQVAAEKKTTFFPSDLAKQRPAPLSATLLLCRITHAKA